MVRALRKPVLLAFVLGCTVSIVASGRLSVRLITDGAVSFAFLPLVEMAALAAVYRTGRRPISFARAVDLFFAGNTPWLLWLVGVATLSCLVPPKQVAPWPVWIAAALAVPVAVWSAYLDFHFFRAALGRPAGGAVRAVVLQRAMAWPAATLYFLGIAIWSYIASWTAL
jgi:hypothetical protein